MSPGSYLRLVEGTRPERASHGDAVELLSAQIVANDPECSLGLTYQPRPSLAMKDTMV